jgi:hypothetical protein
MSYSWALFLALGQSVAAQILKDENCLTHCSPFSNLHLCITGTKWSFSSKFILASLLISTLISEWRRPERGLWNPSSFHPWSTTLGARTFLQLIKAVQTRFQDLGPHCSYCVTRHPGNFSWMPSVIMHHLLLPSDSLLLFVYVAAAQTTWTEDIDKTFNISWFLIARNLK